MTLPDAPRAAARAGFRKRANTRARLLEAAEDVSCEGTPRRDRRRPRRRPGSTRGAFYSNFSSIDEVFYAVYDRQSIRLLEIVAEVTGSISRTSSRWTQTA